MNNQELQKDLLEVFRKHGVSVAVGLTRDGIIIRSQDERVDASNLGKVTVYDHTDERIQRWWHDGD